MLKDVFKISAFLTVRTWSGHNSMTMMTCTCFVGKSSPHFGQGIEQRCPNLSPPPFTSWENTQEAPSSWQLGPLLGCYYNSSANVNVQINAWPRSSFFSTSTPIQWFLVSGLSMAIWVGLQVNCFLFFLLGRDWHEKTEEKQSEVRMGQRWAQREQRQGKQWLKLI